MTEKRTTSHHLVVFDGTPLYHDWCEANDLDPDDDENYIAYCEWKNNQ